MAYTIEEFLELNLRFRRGVGPSVIDTGTCLDVLIPEGLPSRWTILVLSQENTMPALVSWIDLLRAQVQAKHVLREPGDNSWPEDEVKARVFVGELLKSQERGPLLTNPESGTKIRGCPTWLEQAVYLGCTRILYGGHNDVSSTLHSTAGVVTHIEAGRKNTEMCLVRNDRDTQSVGKRVDLVPTEGLPQSVWDLLDEDDL